MEEKKAYINILIDVEVKRLVKIFAAEKGISIPDAAEMLLVAGLKEPTITNREDK